MAEIHFLSSFEKMNTRYIFEFIKKGKGSAAILNRNEA